MSAPVTLRPCQQEAVEATMNHFRQSDESAVIVLPTGAGKSLVINDLTMSCTGRLSPYCGPGIHR